MKDTKPLDGAAEGGPRRRRTPCT